VASAQDDTLEAERQAELERQEIFRSGFQDIVDDLNRNSFERFAHAIDQEDMLERVFGLRLIDPKVKKNFREGFDEKLEGFVKSAFASTEGNIRAAWLGFGSKGNRGKAIVRYDLPDFQFNYHEYELRLDNSGRVIIVDWIEGASSSLIGSTTWTARNSVTALASYSYRWTPASRPCERCWIFRVRPSSRFSR
jgi:hypothetical protein